MKNFNELLLEFDSLHEAKGMLEDVKILYDYTITRGFQNILELGVMHGNSTRTFACAASNLPNTHVTSVDIEEQCCDEVSQRLQSDGLASFVTFVTSDSIEFLNKQPDDFYDCIFIDTTHEFKQTLCELFLASFKVKQHKGYIFMHDVAMPQVVTAIEAFMKCDPNCTFEKFSTPAGLGLVKINRKYEV